MAPNIMGPAEGTPAEASGLGARRQDGPGRSSSDGVRGRQTSWVQEPEQRGLLKPGRCSSESRERSRGIRARVQRSFDLQESCYAPTQVQVAQLVRGPYRPIWVTVVNHQVASEEGLWTGGRLRQRREGRRRRPRLGRGLGDWNRSDTRKGWWRCRRKIQWHSSPRPHPVGRRAQWRTGDR